MKLLRRLKVRLLLSYVGVSAVTLAVMVVALQFLAPTEYETTVDRIGQQYGFSRQTSPTSTSTDVPTGSSDDTNTTNGTGPSNTGSSVPDNGATTTTTPTAPNSTGGPGTTSRPNTTGGPTSTTPGPGSTGTGGPNTTRGPTSTGGSAGNRGDDEGSPPQAIGAVMTPALVAQQGPQGPEGGTRTETFVVDLESAFGDSLNAVLWVAFLVSFALAVVLATVSSRRILRPLQNIQGAARRLAEGRYDERVPMPREIELAELAADVNALGETLEKTEQQRSRLMSDLAHELRTPLTTIQGYMEGLIDGVFEPTPEVFTEVAEEATRLKRLTADLALLSRAEEGALVLDLHTTDLGQVATRAAERLRPQFLDQDVVLSLGPMPDLPVHGDPDRLAQAFTNLVGNALIHTPAGGRVWLTAIAEASTCAVSVHDTGEGIPTSELDQIFERFHRVEGREVAYAGSGIGLTISKTIVRSHGGELSVESAGSGRGSTFTIQIPRATP